MNYRYKISGEDIVLSSQEHEAIQRQIRTGEHATMTFRGGKLGINTSFISFFKETDNPTEIKSTDNEWKSSTPQLLEPIKSNDFIKQSREDFYKKMGWEK